MKKTAILSLAAAAVGANAAILFNDNFENAVYVNGASLNGIISPSGQTWFTTGAAMKVSNARGNTGKSISRDLTAAGNYAWVDTPFDSTTSSDKVMTGAVDTYIESGSDLNTNEFLAGIEAYTFAVDFVSSMRVDSSAGDISILGLQGIGYYIGATAPLDQWNRLTTVIDFDSMMARCKLNGNYIGGGISIDQTEVNDIDLVQSRYFAAAPTQRAYQDNLRIETGTRAANGLSKISGTVTLSDWTLTPDLWFMHVGIVNPVTNTLVDDFFAVPDANGNWMGNTVVAAGSYDVYIKAGTWLSKKTGSITVSAGSTHASQNATLINGDVNSDDLVDIADYSQLAAAFDAVLDEDPATAGDQSSANWDAAADLNGDGIVDIADYSVLAAAFDGVGEAEAIGVTL